MEFLILYGIFVATTLIVTLKSIIWPVVQEIYATNPLPRVAVDGNKTLLVIVLSILVIICAPIVFIAWLFPKLHTLFKDTLVAELKKS